MDGVVASIQLFGGNFAPRNWRLCDGALITISDNSALFSLIGTTFGGDGRTTFGVPDLRGRVAAGTGEGPGLPNRNIGNKWGTETTALGVHQLPTHSHNIVLRDPQNPPSLNVKVNASSDEGTVPTGQDAYWAVTHKITGPSTTLYDTYSTDKDITMAADAVEVSLSGLNYALEAQETGSSGAFSIAQPSIALIHVICLIGVYPSRS